jgi:DUF2924 family protein
MRNRAREVEQRLAEIETYDSGALRQEWQKLYGCPAPKRVRRDLLLRAIAYRIQELAFGGLKPATVRRLKQLADKTRVGPVAPPSAADSLRPGMRLMREWNGETHLVEVVEKGFTWRGQPYPSLSAIARAITGARWSGPRFFGLLDRDREDNGHPTRKPTR